MNHFAITEKEKEKARYLILDTNKTIFRHLKWRDLGSWGRRKCENLIVMQHMNKDRKYVKVIYEQ